MAVKYNAKIEKLSIQQEKIEQEILSLKGGHGLVFSEEYLEGCINGWDNFTFEQKKDTAKVFIKVITITDSEIQIIFN